MKNNQKRHYTSVIPPGNRPQDSWRTDLAHRYSEHLDNLAQHASQEHLSAQELVALLQQEAENIRHQLWEVH
ncbi:uncharacterized protein DUF2732 [Erwinia sp. AG740]|nr:uncharacterized protein DUF2732 [Erwinia sp. AG740]